MNGTRNQGQVRTIAVTRRDVGVAGMDSGFVPDKPRWSRTKRPISSETYVGLFRPKPTLLTLPGPTLAASVHLSVRYQ
jgi:hypothetical protein